MPKPGFTLENIPPLVPGSCDKVGWALCIGAGSSTPLFPNWTELVSLLAQNISSLDNTVIEQLEFSPDALIQSIKNSTNLSDKEFALVMSKILYEKFFSQIDDGDLHAVKKALAADFPGACSTEDWITFIKYRNTTMEHTTANILAKTVVKSISKGIAPKAILTFNAEPILIAILNSYVMEKALSIGHIPPKKLFSKIINSLSSQSAEQIPYVFCHGLLPIDKDYSQESVSINKMVFLEEEYLSLANNAFSWQSTMFIDTCMRQHVIFVGVSLTDPNMRRWLSWMQTNRLREIRDNGYSVTNSTQHYWIRKKPRNKNVISWVEAAVAHLGIRLVWIDDWTQSGLALEKLLGINDVPVFKGKRNTKSKINKKPKYNAKNRLGTP